MKILLGFISIVFLVIGLLIPISVHAATLTIDSTADAYVYNLSPNFNSGSVINVITMNTPSTGAEAKILVKFPTNAIPANATINSATIHMYLVSGSGGSPAAVSVRPATGNWDENSVNWNNKPESGKAGSISEVDKEAGVKTWDATSIVQAWQDGLSNNGVIFTTLKPINADENFSRIFRSREGNNSAERPKLIIDYSVSNNLPQLQLQPGAGQISIAPDALIQAQENENQANVQTQNVPTGVGSVTVTPTKSMTESSQATDTAEMEAEELAEGSESGMLMNSESREGKNSNSTLYLGIILIMLGLASLGGAWFFYTKLRKHKDTGKSESKEKHEISKDN